MVQDQLAGQKMPGMFSKMNIQIAVCAVLMPVFAASPAAGQASAMQELLVEQAGVSAGLATQPAGSVKPTITMEQQIIPCFDKEGAGARALINVMGLENQEGNIRVQVYSSDPEEFLEKGKKLLRVDVPVSSLDSQVCVVLPNPGTYAMVVMHDRNANGRADILTEGFGFSQNPKLMFSKPDHEEVAIAVPEGITEIDVALNYMFRLENKERRRRKRR